MFSIHAFIWEGMPKLYIGTPATITSARSNSASRFVTFSQNLMHPVFTLVGFGEGGVNPVTGYRVGWIGTDIAIDDFVIRAGGAPLFNEFGGKAARVGAVGAGCRIGRGGHCCRYEGGLSWGTFDR